MLGSLHSHICSNFFTKLEKNNCFCSTDSARSTRSKHHHHHRKEHFRQEDLNLRRQKGSEVHLNDALKHYPTEVEEAAFLHKADLEEMSSKHSFFPLLHKNKSRAFFILSPLLCITDEHFLLCFTENCM